MKIVREVSRFGSDGRPRTVSMPKPQESNPLSRGSILGLQLTDHQSDWWGRLNKMADNIDR